MKKIITISSALIGLVFLTGCNLQPANQARSTTPAPGAKQLSNKAINLKTYRNDKYGFEFRYPLNHTPYVAFDSKLNTLNPADSQSNFVSIAENESQVFCCEPSTLAISGIESNSKQLNLPNAKQITFKGYPAVEIIGEGNLSSTYKKIIINKDEQTITITQNAKSDFLNNILSTFKFTNSIDAAADLKIYRNEKYGFEFQYPANWKETTIFSNLQTNSVAFIEASREAQLKASLIPDSDVGAVIIQGTAIFIKPANNELLFKNLEANRSLIKTSEIMVSGQNVLYILHSSKTDPNKFGGGSTEIYVFKNTNQPFAIEANYPGVEPAEGLKTVLDQIISTINLTNRP